MKKGKARKPMGRAGSMLVSLLVTAAIGFAYFYVSLPIFRAADYRQLLTVQTGDFATHIAEISFKRRPISTPHPAPPRPAQIK